MKKFFYLPALLLLAGCQVQGDKVSRVAQKGMQLSSWAGLLGYPNLFGNSKVIQGAQQALSAKGKIDRTREWKEKLDQVPEGESVFVDETLTAEVKNELREHARKTGIRLIFTSL